MWDMAALKRLAAAISGSFIEVSQADTQSSSNAGRTP